MKLLIKSKTAMGTEPVRSLQLVDSERCNRLISTLQQTLERKDIVEQVTASPQEQAYVKSYHDVTKSVKKRSPLAGMDIVNFLNKKDRFKGSVSANAHLPQPPDGNPPADVAGNISPKKKRTGAMSVEGSETKIKNYFKEAGVRKGTAGTLMHRGTQYPIPYDDFIHDLTHDFTRTQPALTQHETTTGLGLLKKIRLPTSHIRSARLRSKYTALREGSTATPSGIISTPKSSSSDDTSSRIPKRSAPQLYNRKTSRFPNIYKRRSRAMPDA